MNVFVIGTERCGTMTFSKACAHITNYSTGHETHAGIVHHGYVDYPANHIEVAPRLNWMLSLLIKRYPDAVYVHLMRKRENVVRSWSRRGIHANCGAAPLLNVICQTDVRS